MTSIPIRSLGGIPIPTIQFPTYTRPQLLRILASHVPDSLYCNGLLPKASGDLPKEELQKIWDGLNSAVMDTFGPGTSPDISTFLRLSNELWPAFVKPILDHGILDEETGEMVFGRVDFVGLFQLAKRAGLFQGEEIVKKQSTLSTAGREAGSCTLGRCDDQ